MGLGVLVQELRNSTQGAFDVVVARRRRRTGYDGDKGGELVGDPVVELVEQQGLLREWEARDQFRHRVLLL
jgi:hypothetical protein